MAIVVIVVLVLILHILITLIIVVFFLLLPRIKYIYIYVHVYNIYVYTYAISPSKEPFKGNLGLPQNPPSRLLDSRAPHPGGARPTAWRRGGVRRRSEGSGSPKHPNPRGPCTADLKTLVPKAMPGMGFGTRVLNWAVYGPFGRVMA